MNEMTIVMQGHVWHALGDFDKVVEDWKNRNPIQVRTPNMKMLLVDSYSIDFILEGWSETEEYDKEDDDDEGCTTIDG